MAKNPHPVEAWEADVLAHAVSWSAFQFRGPHDRHKVDGCRSREEATDAARVMVKDFPRKPALVYGINAEGRQALAETVRPEKETSK